MYPHLPKAISGMSVFQEDIKGCFPVFCFEDMVLEVECAYIKMNHHFPVDFLFGGIPKNIEVHLKSQ